MTIIMMTMIMMTMMMMMIMMMIIPGSDSRQRWHVDNPADSACQVVPLTPEYLWLIWNGDWLLHMWYWYESPIDSWSFAVDMKRWLTTAYLPLIWRCDWLLNICHWYESESVIDSWIWGFIQNLSFTFAIISEYVSIVSYVQKKICDLWEKKTGYLPIFLNTYQTSNCIWFQEYAIC